MSLLVRTHAHRQTARRLAQRTVLHSLAPTTRSPLASMANAARSSLRQRVPSTTSTSRDLHLHSHGSGDHGHSHGHSHSHGHGGHSHGIEETQQLSTAFASLRNPSQLDPGSRITLVGLVANVGLTAFKGVAGFLLASSALLADAAHSGSDLVADVVTLASYRIGRWEPSARYPYGYGKFESLGSLVVSFLLFATAAGIGLHSYHHLLLSLATIPSIPPDLLASLDFLPHGHAHGPEASHSDSLAGDGIVDARAMYFAAASIVVKEWLYRATLKVAREQHSNVLLANAYHHRSDSLGSLVALIAIGAARVGYPMLDPLGGLVVSGMIAKQGWDVGKEALGGLVDQVTDEKVQPSVYEAIRGLSAHGASIEAWKDGRARKGGILPSTTAVAAASTSDEVLHPAPLPASAQTGTLPILSIPSIRLFASGPSLLIDIELVLPSSLTLREANEIERAVAARVRQVVGEERVREVVVRLKAEGEEDELEHEHEHGGRDQAGKKEE